MELYNLILKDKLQKSDVVVWLQGDRYDRAEKVFEIYKKGWASKIIISGNNVLIGNRSREGEDNVSLKEMSFGLIERGVPAENIIIDDRAMNTQEQAEHIIKMAKESRWKNIILVGSSYYQPRAFLTFLKKSKERNWKGRIINQSVGMEASVIPGGRNKTAGELIEEESIKIVKYKNNVVDLESGIKYLKIN